MFQAIDPSIDTLRSMQPTDAELVHLVRLHAFSTHTAPRIVAAAAAALLAERLAESRRA
jgi:hypothetical protein